MAKTGLTTELEKQIWNHTKSRSTFGCFEVTIGWFGNERVDFMTYETKGIFRCYEIKVSKSDFYSGAALSFLGDYNYYVMPIELFEDVKQDIPNHIGVYAYNGKSLVSVKNAKKQELGIDVHILKNSLIRSLYRESERVFSSNDETVVGALRKKVSREKSRAKSIDKKYKRLQENIINNYGASALTDLL